MGGDFGPRFVVPACIAALDRNPSLSIVLVGHPDQVSPLCELVLPRFADRLKLQPALECITMDDAPGSVLRGKPDASMRVALQMVRDGKADACVSAGNTGALMALARHVLKTLPDIDRPAIMTALPAENGRVYILDLGANVDTKPANLLQFALMGSAALEVTGVAAPRVALLNIGIESVKGSALVREAHSLLQTRTDIRYTGYIEADAVFRGEADVVVCDGFVGNVLLKGTEGVARLLSQSLRRQATATLWRRVLARLNASMWRTLRHEWSPDHYNGALLLGVDGLVVKSHGAAGERAILAALELATRAAPGDLAGRVAAQMAWQGSESPQDVT